MSTQRLDRCRAHRLGRKQLRGRQCNVTPRALFDATSVSQAAIAQIQNDAREGSPAMLWDTARVLRVRLADLIGRHRGNLSHDLMI